MPWSDITLPSDTWTDVPNTRNIYLTDQDNEIMTDQDGNPIILQGSTDTDWTDIA